MSRAFRLPVYPKNPHKASGQARVKVRGRHYYLGKFGSKESRQEYARLVQQLASQATEPPKPNGPLTVKGMIARFLKSSEGERTEKQHAHYKRALEIVLANDDVARKPAGDFGLPDLTAAREAMIRKGWAAGYLSAAMTRIKKAWRWAEEQGHVPRGAWGHLQVLGPLSRTDRRVKRTAPRQGVELADVQAVLPFLPAMVQAMAELQWWTAMRPGEVVKMRAGDVEDRGDGLRVYMLRDGKNAWRDGEEPELIVLGPEAWRVLEPWLKAAKLRGKDTFLWPTSRPTRGAHYKTAGYSRAIARAFDQHPELTRWTPYALRHAAKRRIKRSHGLDAARAILRHRSVQMTDNYDRQRDLEIAKEAAREVG